MPWQTALGVVFWSGVLCVLLTATGARQRLVDAVSPKFKLATAAGIGLFIAFIGLSSGGLVVAQPAMLVQLGDLSRAPALFTVWACSSRWRWSRRACRPPSSGAWSARRCSGCWEDRPSRLARRVAPARPAGSADRPLGCAAAALPAAASRARVLRSVRQARHAARGRARGRLPAQRAAPARGARAGRRLDGDCRRRADRHLAGHELHRVGRRRSGGCAHRACERGDGAALRRRALLRAAGGGGGQLPAARPRRR
jgi:hypothetical protein